jgi:hypothetical protein
MRKRAFYADFAMVMALYNIVVGVLAFFLYKRIFTLFDMVSFTPARPPAIQIPCLFLVVFGIGYALALRDLVRNRIMLFVGLLQNAAVTGMVIYYQISRPDLVHPVYFLPAGLSAVFAVFFLMAWFGALVDARRQRRQERRLVIKPAPRPAAAAPKRTEAPCPREPEPPEEEPLLEEAFGPQEEPEQGEPEPPESLAHRDRSGIPPDETPGTSG